MRGFEEVQFVDDCLLSIANLDAERLGLFGNDVFAPADFLIADEAAHKTYRLLGLRPSGSLEGRRVEGNQQISIQCEHATVRREVLEAAPKTHAVENSRGPCFRREQRRQERPGEQ